MSKKIRAITIDPFLKIILETEIENSLSGLQGAIDDNMIEAVYIDDKNVMYVDDEGLFKQNQSFFVFNKEVPLAGKAVIVGANHTNGTDVSTKLKVTDVAAKIGFHTVQEIAAMRLGQ